MRQMWNLNEFRILCTCTKTVKFSIYLSNYYEGSISEEQEDTIEDIQQILPEHVVKILKRIFPILIPFVNELFFYMPEGEKVKRYIQESTGIFYLQKQTIVQV